MSRMTRKNLRSIKARFAEKTGAVLEPAAAGHFPARKLAVLAAVVAMCLALAAFGWPLFSSLDGDELSLYGTYEGGGIVSVRVENRSDKKLSFQEQTKLMRWVTSQEVPGTGGAVKFENTEFAPHSEGVMRLDLSEAYDVASLEQSATNEEWFYLILTNNEFLFGQDWMCSIHFTTAQTEPAEEETKSTPAEQEILEKIREELRFYFEESYENTLMAFNEANFLYQQKVQEVLARFEGKVVPSLSPKIMVGGPTAFLTPEPIMGDLPEGTVVDEAVPPELQSRLVSAEWGYRDAYGRMVATADEKTWIQMAMLPLSPGQTDGGAALPLCFLFVYDAAEAVPENYAFLYGQIYSFGELESCLVRRDEHYAIYDATGLIYTDVDAYLDDFLAANPEVYCDDQIRQRVRNIYALFRDREALAERIQYLWITE